MKLIDAQMTWYVSSTNVGSVKRVFNGNVHFSNEAILSDRTFGRN